MTSTTRVTPVQAYPISTSDAVEMVLSESGEVITLTLREAEALVYEILAALPAHRADTLRGEVSPALGHDE